MVSWLADKRTAVLLPATCYSPVYAQASENSVAAAAYKWALSPAARGYMLRAQIIVVQSAIYLPIFNRLAQCAENLHELDAFSRQSRLAKTLFCHFSGKFLFVFGTLISSWCHMVTLSHTTKWGTVFDIPEPKRQAEKTNTWLVGPGQFHLSCDRSTVVRRQINFFPFLFLFSVRKPFDSSTPFFSRYPDLPRSADSFDLFVSAAFVRAPVAEAFGAMPLRGLLSGATAFLGLVCRIDRRNSRK